MSIVEIADVNINNIMRIKLCISGPLFQGEASQIIQINKSSSFSTVQRFKSKLLKELREM